jgi:hypothetical protein
VRDCDMWHNKKMPHGKIDLRSNCLETCKFLIFAIIDFNKTYQHQMSNVNNLFLIICAMGTCMISKLTVGCKVKMKTH